MLLGLVSFAFSLVALLLSFTKNRFALVLAVLAFGITLTPAATGVVGTYLGRSKVDSVLGVVTADQRERLKAVGYAEAAQCTKLGLGFGALPMVLGLAAVGVAFARRPQGAS